MCKEPEKALLTSILKGRPDSHCHGGILLLCKCLPRKSGLYVEKPMYWAPGAITASMTRLRSLQGNELSEAFLLRRCDRRHFGFRSCLLLWQAGSHRGAHAHAFLSRIIHARGASAPDM